MKTIKGEPIKTVEMTRAIRDAFYEEWKDDPKGMLKHLRELHVRFLQEQELAKKTQESSTEQNAA